MNFYSSISDYPDCQNVVLSIGKFSSLHLGHQRVMRKMVALAHKKNSKEEKVRSLLLLVLPEKESRLFLLDFCRDVYKAIGIDDVILFSLEAICRITYEEFLNKLLKKFNLSGFVASDKLSIGHKKSGTPKKITLFLKKHYAAGEPIAKKLDILWFSSITFADVIENLENYEEWSKFVALKNSRSFFNANLFISSSILIDFIKKGYAQKIRKFTFLPFMLQGIVYHGKGKGREYGFPTANFSYPDGLVLCKKGSYVSFALFNGQCYYAMTYVGIARGKVFVETYLFYFQGLLYNEYIKVFLLSRLRDDQKPHDVQHLKDLLVSDAKASRAFFDDFSRNKGFFSCLRLLKRFVDLGFLKEAKVVSNN